MDKNEKLNMMNKMIRELDDIKNSQTSVLKKMTQLEAENINLGNAVLDKKLPDIHSHIDDAITAVSALQEEFQGLIQKFITDNNLGAEPAP
jgi:hypothetical protein